MKAILPPKILKSESIKCGRAIKVEWNPPPRTEPETNPLTGYELALKSLSGDSESIFYNSSDVFSHEFVDLKINTVYELNLRAKNSNGFGLWAKRQLTTTAGRMGNRTLHVFLLFVQLISLRCEAVFKYYKGKVE